MRLLTLFLFSVCITITAAKPQTPQTLKTEFKVDEHIDSLNRIQKWIRLAGLDHENVKGYSCMVRDDGTVNIETGVKKFTVAANPLVIWTGSPGKFIQKFMASGGAKKMLTVERLEHIMARHFPKYEAGVTKGYCFSPAMTVKRLHKYIDATIKKGKCIVKDNRIIFEKTLKNPEGYKRTYNCIMNKKGTIITFFAKKF